MKAMCSNQPDVILVQASAGQQGQLPATALMAGPPELFPAIKQGKPLTSILEVRHPLQPNLALRLLSFSCTKPCTDVLYLM